MRETFKVLSLLVIALPVIALPNDGGPEFIQRSQFHVALSPNRSKARHVG